MINTFWGDAVYQTKNDSTMVVGQATATGVALSRSRETRKEIVTWELIYPRYIHGELMTHRAFSRNAASSRATPVAAMVREVRENPCFFDELQYNRRGMTGGEPVDAYTAYKIWSEWNALARQAADVAEHWSRDFSVAKQVCNRILEPFSYIRVIVTATELDNFFRLRLAKDAQPEMQNLAKAMLKSYVEAERRCEPPGEADLWHIPYRDAFEEKDVGDLIVRSIAACARVSVVRGDGKATTLEEDKLFVQSLYDNHHMSPFEHVAYACPGDHYNLNGWKSVRCLLEQDRCTLDGVLDLARSW